MPYFLNSTSGAAPPLECCANTSSIDAAATLSLETNSNAYMSFAAVDVRVVHGSGPALFPEAGPPPLLLQLWLGGAALAPGPGLSSRKTSALAVCIAAAVPPPASSVPGPILFTAFSTCSSHHNWCLNSDSAVPPHVYDCHGAVRWCVRANPFRWDAPARGRYVERFEQRNRIYTRETNQHHDVGCRWQL